MAAALLAIVVLALAKRSGQNRLPFDRQDAAASSAPVHPQAPSDGVR